MLACMTEKSRLFSNETKEKKTATNTKFDPPTSLWCNSCNDLGSTEVRWDSHPASSMAGQRSEAEELLRTPGRTRQNGPNLEIRTYNCRSLSREELTESRKMSDEGLSGGANNIIINVLKASGPPASSIPPC